jgi:hypothetical protein
MPVITTRFVMACLLLMVIGAESKAMSAERLELFISNL